MDMETVNCFGPFFKYNQVALLDCSHCGSKQHETLTPICGILINVWRCLLYYCYHTKLRNLSKSNAFEKLH